MKRSMFVLVVCAMFGIAISSQPEQASSQVEVPRDVVSVPSDELVVPIIEPAFTSVEGEVCVDGSCSPAMSSSGPVASAAQTPGIEVADRDRRHVRVVQVDGHELRTEAQPHDRNTNPRVDAHVLPPLPDVVTLRRR